MTSLAPSNEGDQSLHSEVQLSVWQLTVLSRSQEGSRSRAGKSKCGSFKYKNKCRTCASTSSRIKGITSEPLMYNLNIYSVVCLQDTCICSRSGL